MVDVESSILFTRSEATRAPSGGKGPAPIRVQRAVTRPATDGAPQSWLAGLITTGPLWPPCGSSSVAERRPSKSNVAGSSPVSRSGVVQGMAIRVQGPGQVRGLPFAPKARVKNWTALLEDPEPAFVQGRAWGHVTEEQGPGGRGGRSPRNYKPGFAGVTPVGHHQGPFGRLLSHGGSSALNAEGVGPTPTGRPSLRG
jgi:hypothetical protein